MKHSLLLILATCALTATAQTTTTQSTTTTQGTSNVAGMEVSGVKMARHGKLFAVDMNMDLKNMKVRSNRAVTITPVLKNGTDSLELKGFSAYGRRRYIQYVRNGQSLLTGENDRNYRASKLPDTIDYHTVVPYEKWMNGATLTLRRQDYGCCNTLLNEQLANLGTNSETFFPTLVYAQPEGNAEKHESLKRTAYIDFPVDKTVIYPEYRRNVTELGKIRATIDSVRSDKDITITSVWLKGFASPESPYAHNTDLAIGRTAALKNYIQQLYHFADGTITTEYEPEDWAGLRRFVEVSDLKHRDEILMFIDSDLDPDVKEQRIKKTYPEEYRYLLNNCYPALRHTEYRVDYTIRSYTDIEEIKRVMQTQPQKLSLNEFYLLSQQYEPGSDEFTEVFETAVRMYPTDEHANLNAANAALRRGDLKRAETYLAKAGNSAEAVYARGAHAILSEDYDSARTLLKQAESMGLQQATETLKGL